MLAVRATHSNSGKFLFLQNYYLKMKAKPSSAAERLADLATRAKEDGKQEIAGIILKVKAEKEPDDNLKGLKNAKKTELASTYAYLLNKEEKDKEVSSLNVDGLRLMILHRLNTLMPKECEKCLKDHTPDREDIPKVICIRCDHKACPECFSEPMDGWVYVCQPCKKVVKDDLGVNRLEEKHFLKSSRPKKKGLITLEEDGENEDDGEEEEEDDDTSDEATQAYEEPAETDAEKEEAEGIENAFLPASWKKKRGFKNKEAKKDNKEEKTKVCIHHRKGRCNFGMSGKKKVDGEWKKCPFAHPRVCEKLLSNGDRGKFGCKGDCKKLHPKMCYSSLNSKKCPHDKDCRNGYHVRGTIKIENAFPRAGNQRENAFPRAENLGGNAFPRAGRQEENGTIQQKTGFPQAGPSNQSGTPPFFDLGQKVREEILQVLKELKMAAPPPPPAPKIISKEDLREALKELFV